MTGVRRLLAALSAVLVLAGCGGGGSSTSSSQATTSALTSSPAPSTISVLVEISDSVPLDVIENAGHGLCTSRSTTEMIDEVMANQKPLRFTPVAVTLKDAAGTIVGQQKLPRFGGSWSGGRCDWSITFDDVPAGAYFSATLEGYQFEDETSGAAAAGLVFRE